MSAVLRFVRSCAAFFVGAVAIGALLDLREDNSVCYMVWLACVFAFAVEDCAAGLNKFLRRTDK